jgi:hypothetical protein
MISTPAGLEPTRENPVDFESTALNHSATVPYVRRQFFIIYSTKHANIGKVV